MRWIRVPLAILIMAGACTDSSVLSSDATQPGTDRAGALVDGANGGDPDFFFLPPLVKSPEISGTFNGSLAPRVEVCELDPSLPGSDRGDCHDPAVVVAEFQVQDMTISDGEYKVEWDTDGSATTPLDLNLNYRIRVWLGTELLGLMDVNPQDPSAQLPSDNETGLYAFRLGETIPIKFWISEGVLCQGAEGKVVECTELAWYNDQGISAFIEGEGDRMGFSCVANCRSQADPAVVTLIIERLDVSPHECVQGLDTPVFGECLRLRTEPVLAYDMEIPGVISICADLSTFGVLNHEQEELLQIHRQSDDRTETQILANAPSAICGDEPPPTGTARTGGTGMTRFGSLALDRLTDFFGPRPLVAGDFLGALSTRLSTFGWSVPCQLGILAGADQAGSAGIEVATPPRVNCLDANGEPVRGARVHFDVIPDGNGSVTFATSGSDEHGAYLETDAQGEAVVTSWTLGARGDNRMEAFGFGLLGPDDAFDPHLEDPNDLAVQWDIGRGSAEFSATAAGAPASILPAETDLGTEEVGVTLSPLQITVNDDGGGAEGTAIGVPNATVTWTLTGGGCLQTEVDGTCHDGTGADPITTITDGQGQSTVTWTLGTGAGTQTLTASVGGITTTYSIAAIAGEPVELVRVSGNDQTGFPGQALADPLAVKVEDQYDNPVQGASVSWSVVTGGGSVSPTSSVSDALGAGSTTWTMGGQSGSHTARASLVTTDNGTLTVDFSASVAACVDGWGTASNIDGVLDAEWSCAHSEPMDVNLGGGEVDATLYWMNDATNLYMAVVLNGADKENSLRVEFDNDADEVEEVGDDAFNLDPVTGYSDEYLTQKCLTKGQSGCGEPDTTAGGSNDGTGVFDNTAGVTVYEIAKPLSSGDAAHDFALAPGDDLQFFLTLRLGNGAKGNTQWPNFRKWWPITLADGTNPPGE